MPVDTAILSLENPVFHTYVLAASIMILKLMLQPWMTVVRMTKTGVDFAVPKMPKEVHSTQNRIPSNLRSMSM